MLERGTLSELEPFAGTCGLSGNEDDEQLRDTRPDFGGGSRRVASVHLPNETPVGTSSLRVRLHRAARRPCLRTFARRDPARDSLATATFAPTDDDGYGLARVRHDAICCRGAIAVSRLPRGYPR
jgi:hypothetical protein